MKKEIQTIAFGICIGSLLSMIVVVILKGNELEVLCISPITIISALVYDRIIPHQHNTKDR